MANRNKKVLDAVATGTSEIIDTLGATHLTMSALFSAGVSAGVVTFESSPDPAFAGTWKALGTAGFAASTVVTVSVDVAARYVRARISTAITGGTVTAWITTAGFASGAWD
jgi:hypothetical protein